MAKTSALAIALLTGSNSVLAIQVAEGGGTATATEAIAIGAGSKAEAVNSVVIGVGANSKPTNATNPAEGSGSNGVAIGTNATVKDEDSVAIGHNAKNTPVLEGANKDQVQTAKSAVTIGHNSSTHFSGAIAVGHNAEARGQSAIVIGENAKTISPWNGTTNRFNQAYRTVLIGFSSQASGSNAIGMGTHTQALANDAMVFGREANSGHIDTIVMGREAKTQGSLSASHSSIAIGTKAKAGSADQYRPSTAVGANSYAGASFSKATNYAEAPEGLDMSRGSTAIGANAGAAYNIVDLLKSDTTDTITNQTVKAGTEVYRHIIRDENNKITDVKFYTSKRDKGDGTGEFTYSYIDADKVNQGYITNMGTTLDNNEAVLKKSGFLSNGVPTTSQEWVSAQETRMAKVKKNGTDIIEEQTTTSNAYKNKDKTANQQVAVGLQSRAVGNDAVAVGAQSIAGDNSVVVGGGVSGDAFGGSYVKAQTGALNRYATNRDQSSQAKDIDLAVTGSQGTVLNEYLKQTGRERLTTWNTDSASYGISGSTVLGAQAHSTAPIGVAVGISSTVARGALGAIAIGPVATVEPNSIGSMAFGMGTRVQVAANNAIAFGTGAEVKSSDAKKAAGAIAIGHKAISDKANSVALGSESSTENRVATKEEKGTLKATTADGKSQIVNYGGFKGVPGKSDALDSNYFVTVGSASIKRQIKDVAAGKVSADSTDAINGSQLFAAMTSGWNITGHDKNTIVESIAPTEKVSFINGTGTTSTVLPDNNNATVTFNVNKSGITFDNDEGAGTGKVTAEKTGDVFATAETVVNAINNSGFRLKTDETDGTNLTPEPLANGELINPGDEVIMQAGKNMIVIQEEGSKITYATKSDVDFNSVSLSNGTTYVNLTPTENGLNVAKKDGSPAKISNVEGNLPGAAPNTNSPTTNQAAPTNVDDIKNNAATVGDVLNAGWNLQGNGDAKDFVKPYDTVNFNNGTGTTAKVETNDNLVSNITFDVNKADITVAETGTDAGKASADAGDVFATAETVADAINKSGFTLKTSANGGEKDTASTGDELINPADVVEMVAGKNMHVKQAANGKITYATKDDVEFNSVKVGNPADNKPVVNMTAEAAKPVTNNAEAPTTALNITSTDGKPTQITGVGSTLNTKPVITAPEGDGSDKPEIQLVDLVGTADAPVNKNAAATVGDLQNMGWVVSSDKTTEGSGAYKDAVKNANEVKFVGEGTALVSGKTVDGVRTITVKVDDQLTTNNSITPVVYTTADGTTVYPTGKDENGNPIFNTKPDGSGNPVDAGDVITSVNGPKGTKAPTELANVKSHLPQVDDVAETVFNPATGVTAPKADGKANINKAPLTSVQAAEIAKNFANHAATVGDVMNAGWNLKGNGKEVDFVKPYDTVNFNNGVGTTAKVVTDDNLVSNISFDVNKSGITANPAGNVTAGTKGDYFATAETVAEAINKSGFTLKTSANGGAKLSGDDELINPADMIDMAAGKNLTVKQAAKGQITYATAENVDFTSVTVGNPTYTDKAGNAVTKQGDKYFDAQGNEVKPEDVTAQAGEAVKLVSEKATPATNNQNANAPTTALNITSADGKPTQIKGVGSVLNTQNVATSTGTQGTTPAVAGVDKLVNLGTPTAPLAEVILNSAATVRDLANMGWVVSTTEGNGYVNTVKNANQVNFKGENGISVTGKDGENGVRDITVSLKTGSVDGKGDGSATGDKGFVTGEQVANAINKSGWNLAANGTAGSEQINPTETVKFDAGKNMEVKRDGANITYATKDDVEFNSVHVGNPTYADENGAPVTKQGDKYFDKDGKEVAADTVVANPSVKMTAEKATPAINNQADAPTTALNVTSADGKPTQIKGVGSVLDTQEVKTSTGKQGETDAVAGTKNLVNLGTDPVTGESSLPDATLNSAATVRDLANMGWVVSTEDGNGYVDTVKNANHVDFKGEGLAAVTGKTLADGTRQITVSVKTGEVTPTEATLKDDPTTKVVKVGDKYYKTTDVDLATGKVNTGAAEIPADQVVNNPNAGTGLVTGNQVGDAIQRSGFVIGKQDNMLAAADYQNKDERVNPDDNVRFADGNNTNVKLATKESIDASGKVVTTTTVKVDVVGLPVQYTTADGTPVTKVGDKFYKVDAAGNPTAETVEPSELVTNMINPTAAPNTTGDAVALGNVKGNLQGAAPQTTSPVDSAIAPTNVNANNAATVGDVLNAGFNLQNNGEARDFVKPYDTVNFVNGQGTKAVVTTDANNQISDVKVDIDTGTLTNNADGTVNGVTDAATATQLAKDLDDARTTLANLPANAPVNVVNAAKAAVLDAEKAADAAGLNKVATVQNVAEAINKSGFTLKTSATTEGAKDTASTGDELINPGKSVEMVAGKNMTVKQEASGKVTYSTKDDVNFNSVQFGNNGPTIQAGNDQYGSNIQVSNANGGPTRITNVAAGINDTDAVNVSQLRGVDNKVNNIQGQVNKLGKRMNAGVAGAMAAANLMQPHKPGQSALTAAVGQHRNQAAVAAGYSRLSDNGKYGIKLSFGANTQGEVSSGAGVAYFW